MNETDLRDLTHHAEAKMKGGATIKPEWAAYVRSRLPAMRALAAWADEEALEARAQITAKRAEIRVLERRAEYCSASALVRHNAIIDIERQLDTIDAAALASDARDGAGTDAGAPAGDADGDGDGGTDE
jgi:hypothetical protein